MTNELSLITTLSNIISDGLRIDLVFTLIQLILVAYLMIWLRGIIINEVAWRSFKSSLYIGLNTYVRIEIGTQYFDGQIESATRRRIIINCRDVKIYLPIKSFADRDWVILKMEKTIEKND